MEEGLLIKERAWSNEELKTEENELVEKGAQKAEERR